MNTGKPIYREVISLSLKGVNKMTEKTLTINTGTNVDEATVNAHAFAQAVYNAIPTGQAAGQTFKNEFVKAFLGTSSRAANSAREFLGVGYAKAVDGDTSDDNDDEYEEDDYSDSYDDDEDYECCEFCG